jgi:hypothetical protein
MALNSKMINESFVSMKDAITQSRSQDADSNSSNARGTRVHSSRRVVDEDMKKPTFEFSQFS